MGTLDEALQAEGSPVIRINGKEVRGVVAPGAHACKLPNRHDLNRIHTKALEILEPSRDRNEFPGPEWIIVIKGTNVQLINDELIPGRHGEMIIRPVKLGIMNDRVTNRACNFPCIGINPPDHSSRGDKLILVWITNLRPFHLNQPVAAFYRLHRMSGSIPVIE